MYQPSLFACAALCQFLYTLYLPCFKKKSNTIGIHVNRTRMHISRDCFNVWDKFTHSCRVYRPLSRGDWRERVAGCGEEPRKRAREVEEGVRGSDCTGWNERSRFGRGWRKGDDVGSHPRCTTEISIPLTQFLVVYIRIGIGMIIDFVDSCKAVFSSQKKLHSIRHIEFSDTCIEY